MPCGTFLCLGLRWTCLFVFLEHVSGYLFYYEEVTTTTTCLWEQRLLFGCLTNREETLIMIQPSSLIHQSSHMGPETISHPWDIAQHSGCEAAHNVNMDYNFLKIDICLFGFNSNIVQIKTKTVDLLINPAVQVLKIDFLSHKLDWNMCCVCKLLYVFIYIRNNNFLLNPD